MTDNKQIPRIFCGDESFILCGNREGFQELQEKIPYLLDSESGEIQLSSPYSDHDFITICLTGPDFEPKANSIIEICMILGILFSLTAFTMIGFSITLKWLWQLIF